MAKVKVAILFVIAILLFSTLTYAAGPEQALDNNNSPPNSQQGVDFDHESGGGGDDSCEGEGEEECLTRRTLAAHVDYIYTQKHNP